MLLIKSMIYCSWREGLSLYCIMVNVNRRKPLKLCIVSFKMYRYFILNNNGSCTAANLVQEGIVIFLLLTFPSFCNISLLKMYFNITN